VAHVAHAQAHDVSHGEPVSCNACVCEFHLKPFTLGSGLAVQLM
jgi:hypothetical protein